MHWAQESKNYGSKDVLWAGQSLLAFPFSLGDCKVAQGNKALEKAEEANSVAVEALNGVYGEKQALYGESIDNHERIARIANAIKSKDDGNFYTADNVCMVLMALKLSRMQLNFHRDNFVDLIGYAEIRHRVQEKYRSVGTEEIVILEPEQPSPIQKYIMNEQENKKES
jgi:predicted RND superfamily exporter protein